jgi:Flp pilus assembly protein TadG
MRCNMDRRQRTFFQKQDGSVILETALMITVILVLSFGIVDFGRVMYTSNSLISAAREGARFGAVMPVVNSALVDSVVRSRFNSYTFGGDTLKDADITVTDLSASPKLPSVRVGIAYSFKWITPVARLMGWTSGSSFTSTLHSRAEYRYEGS